MVTHCTRQLLIMAKPIEPRNVSTFDIEHR